MRVLLTWIKSWFVCIHLPSKLTVVKRTEKVYDDGEYEDWMCECDCKCGKKGVIKRFSFSKEFLAKNNC